MNLEKVALEIKGRISGEVLIEEPLRKYTTWRIGGIADILVLPETIDSVREVCRYTKEAELPLYILGNGSNILVTDKGIRGVVLKLNKLKNVSVQGDQIVAQGGALLPKVVKVAIEKGLTGLEFGAGIPASIGGATVMNAGTYLGQMADCVQEVKVVDDKGDLFSFDKDDLKYSYRSSSLKGKKLIVVETTFQCLKEGNISEAKDAIRVALERRKNTQPLNLPNAGSVFKNPPGDSAGRLIEAAGLKGYRLGDAQISEKHANFIVNLGSATAEEVIGLVNKVQNLVAEKFSVKLEPEIIILGE